MYLAGTVHVLIYNLYDVHVRISTQTKLVNVAESISSKLTYFTELEKLGTRLNSPTLSVTSESFLALLSRLDECISFIEQNVNTLLLSFMSYTLYIYNNNVGRLKF